MQPIIQLDAGWRQIDEQGLQKLQAILRTGSLHDQATANTSSSSSSMAAAKQPPTAAFSFTNDEYARLYTSVHREREGARSDEAAWACAR